MAVADRQVGAGFAIQPAVPTWSPLGDRGPHTTTELTSRTCFLLDLSLLAQVTVAPRSSTVCSGMVRLPGCLCGSKGTGWHSGQ